MRRINRQNVMQGPHIEAAAARPVTRKRMQSSCGEHGFVNPKSKRLEHAMPESEGLRVLVTRGDSRTVVLNFDSHNNNTENTYDKRATYATAIGFYSKEGLKRIHRKRASVSPRNGITLKEQKAFENLKAFVVTNQPEEQTVKAKKPLKVLQLSPLLGRRGSYNSKVKAN